MIIESSADLAWFPLKSCSRCGGCGQYSFTPKWGTTCFGCGSTPGVPGSGLAVANKATGALLAEYRKAVKAAKTRTAYHLVPGDVVWCMETGRPVGEKRGPGEWVEVVAVEKTDQWASGTYPGGHGRDTNCPMLVTAWRHDVTLANGQTFRLGAETIRTFSTGVDRRPYVEDAWATTPVKVQKARKIVLAIMGAS